MRHTAGLSAPSNFRIAQDRFTDSDSTSLDAHNLNLLRLSAGWTVDNGAVEISGNLGTIVTAPAIATIDASTPDVQLLGVTHSISAGKFSLAFRLSNTSNYWRAELDTADSFRLIKVVSGTPSTADSTSLTVDAAVNYTLKITCKGNQIIASVGDTALSATDAHNNTATKHGIWGDSTDIRFAYFRLRAI